jgi:signal transduction histidine kinase
LTYGGLLAALLLILGVVLSLLIGRVLYTNELSTFQNEARAIVTANQRSFDSLVAGEPLQQCTDALSYQQAFDQAIGAPLDSFAGVQSAYLLDKTGKVIAPTNGAVAVGQVAPYVEPARVRALVAQFRARRSGASTTDAAYQVTQGVTQRVGVELLALRFRTNTFCDGTATSDVGVIAVVTTFPRAQAALSAVRLLLLLAFLGALGVGIIIGGPLISRALSPLTRMTRTARNIAAGDLSQRVRLPHASDEIGQLADAFDEMIERIERAFAAQQASEDRVRQFVADASHELRTPLTAIRGYTDVLLRGAKDDPATTEEVLIATRREAERMSRLVNDLLTLARLDEGRPLNRQSVDVVALAGEAVDQARILAGEREVAIRTDGKGRLFVNADSDRLRQVLLVLLDNALKYGRPAPEGWVLVSVERTPRNAIMRVADNGQGIPSEDLPHIFDRFYRAERAARKRQLTAALHARSGAHASASPAATIPSAPDRSLPRAATAGGSGLGLAIAQAIVKAHGGTIEVQSQPGAGTTFTISFPLSA